jgi:hypothetical protein
MRDRPPVLDRLGRCKLYAIKVRAQPDYKKPNHKKAVQQKYKKNNVY